MYARITLLIFALAAMFTVPVSNAAGADARDFDPGYIISDSEFYESDSMNAGQVQAFLNGINPNCVPGPDGTPCLKDYVENTPDTPARSGCLAHAGRDGELASKVIADVAAECGINPKVLIVLLQKEQGLVTASGRLLTPERYERATGLSCPDGPDGKPICDPAHGGFYKQVRGAGERFNDYRDKPGTYRNYRPGQTWDILYHPNRACGTGEVHVSNMATTLLYTYTPYQPNEAALNNLYGTGDECSSYGNRNFWRTYTDWFGSPTSDNCIVTNDCQFYLVNDWTTSHARLGVRITDAPGGTPLSGSWAAGTTDSVGIRHGRTMYLQTDHTTGPASITYRYGREGDDVFVGDWDGDGVDTPAVRRGNTWYLTNTPGAAYADITFRFGRAGDTVLVGDWNGDGRDTPAVRRGNTVYQTNEFVGGNAEHEYHYGRAGDEVLVGDWNGSGEDTLGVRRGNTYFLKNTTTGGPADIVMNYGRAADRVVVGDWDGSGTDTLGVYRP